MTKKYLYPLIPFLLVSATKSLCAASLLTAGISPVKLDADAENASSGEARISVFGDTLRYASDPGDSLGVDTTAAGTVQDYRFFSYLNASSATTAANGTNDLISDISGSLSSKPYAVTIWDDTNPGATFAATPDATTSGLRGAVAGSVDITGLTSGTIYFIYGNNGSSTSRGFTNITMSGTGSDQVLSDYNDVVSAGNGIAATFITSVDFTNEGDYDTISYDTEAFTYFSGVVITAVPEPSAFALLAGCFGFAWVMIRRR